MNDPLINEVRRIRHEISKEIGPNLDAVIDRYSRLESRFTKSVLTKKDRREKNPIEATDHAAPEGHSSPTTR